MEPILQYLSKIDSHSPTLERNTFDSTMGKDIAPEDRVEPPKWEDVSDLEESVIVESRSLLPKGQTITFDWNFDGKVVPVTGVIQKILKDKKSINPAQKYLYQIKLTVPATVELRPGKTLTVKRTSMKNIQR